MIDDDMYTLAIYNFMMTGKDEYSAFLDKKVVKLVQKTKPLQFRNHDWVYQMLSEVRWGNW